MTSLAEYRSTRELFTNLTLRELRSKYKRSVLGWAWSLLNPLANMLIFTLVFRYFLKIKAPPGVPSGLDVFALFLLCGLLPWNYLSNGIMGSIGSLVGNSNLIKKTFFPRELIIFAQVASWLVSHLLEMLVLLIALLVFGNIWLPELPGVLVMIVILTVFVTGLSLVFGILNVYFRDVQHLIGIVFQVWFYMTPIVYPITFVPVKAQIFGRLVPVKALYSLNPMVGFVEDFRDLLYDLRYPPLASVAYLLVVSVVTFGIRLMVFNRLDGRLAEEL